MEDESKTTSRSKKAVTIQDALKNIDITLLKKESSTPENSGKTSLITGTPERVRVQLKNHGNERGIVGYAQLSSGETISHDLPMNTMGLPAMPSLMEQDWRLIDKEISTEGYEYPVQYPVSEEGEKKWMPVLIQMEAALRVAPAEQIITRLTRLRALKPTQKMDTNMNASFFSDLTELLREDEFCYTAIDEGIKAILRAKEGKFFPDYERLRHYVYPIHWKMRTRANKLHDILLRRET